jgi:hypothetical protein
MFIVTIYSRECVFTLVFKSTSAGLTSTGEYWKNKMRSRKIPQRCKSHVWYMTYGMDIKHIYFMFAAFSRGVQSIFVFCIQLSRVIVSATFVVTSPFTCILFIWVVMDIVFLRRSYYKSYSVFSTCASVQCSHWLISLYIVLIKIGFSGDTMHRLLLNSVFFFWICELKPSQKHNIHDNSYK